MRKRVIFFNPHAGILEHLKIERDFARVTSKSGFELDIVRCNRLFSENCNVMSAKGITLKSSSELRQAVCFVCAEYDKSSRGLASNQFGFLEDLMNIEIKKKVESILIQITHDNWSDFQFDGDYIGRYASYEFLLRNKIVSLDVTEDLWDELKLDISYYLFSYFLALEWLKNREYQYVGVYNFLYGVNRAVVTAAKKLEIPTFSIQANGFLYSMHSRYMIYPTTNDYWYLNSSSEWKSIQGEALNLASLVRVARHLKSLTAAKSLFTYSAPSQKSGVESIRKKFDLPEDKRIYLLTTSSADEIFSFGFVGLLRSEDDIFSNVFADAKDWILSTIEIFRSQPDKFLIIRIHPREFANRRDSVNSKYGNSLVNFLNNLELPENVRLNLPEDNISLYDLASITELLINSTSTVGLEFAALGVPSISISSNKLTAYPKDLSFSIHSREQYRLMLSVQIPQTDKNFKRIAFRWINFKHNLILIRIPMPLRFLDRLYFGPIRRFVDRVPVSHSLVNIVLKFLYGIASLFDRRRIESFNTITGHINRNISSEKIESFFLRH